MIDIKLNLNFQKHKLDVNYYIVDSITDFEYFIILMTNDAIRNDKSLEDSINEFTKGDNDLKTLIIKRFNTLFKTNIDNYLSVEEKSFEMENDTSKLTSAIDKREYYFNPELGLYLVDGRELLSKSELFNSIGEEFTRKSNTKFSKINLTIDDKQFRSSSPISSELSPKFDYINILNVENIKNEELVSDAINQLIDATTMRISFKPTDIKEMKEYDDDYSVIMRDMNLTSSYTKIVDTNEIWNDIQIEFSFNDDRFIINEFANYKGVVLSKEKIYSFNDFRQEKLYEEFLDKKEINSLSSKFLSLLLKYASTKNELEIIKSNNLYSLNKDNAFNKLELMIETNINIINDELVATTELFDYWYRKSPQKLYRYLQMFYGDNKFDNIHLIKKNEILYSIFNMDSSILSEQDYKYIEDLSTSTHIFKESADVLIQAIASKRSKLMEGVSNIDKHISSLPKEYDQDEIDELHSLKKEIDRYRRMTNFFVHISDPETKKSKSDFKKDNDVVKEYNKELIKFKEYIQAYDPHNINTHSGNDEHLIILKELESDINSAIDKYLKLEI